MPSFENTTSGLFKDLTAVLSMVSTADTLVGEALNCCHRDFDTVEAKPGQGQSIKIPLPLIDRSNVQNIGSGAVTLHNAQLEWATIPFDQNFRIGITIKDWDQFRSILNMRELYVKPIVSALYEKANEHIAKLFIPTNFAEYTAIAQDTDAVVDAITLPQIAKAKAYLENAGVPLHPSQTFLICDAFTYGLTLAQSSFSHASVTGEAAAEAARQRGEYKMVLGCQMRKEPMLYVGASTQRYAYVCNETAVGAVFRFLPHPPEGQVIESVHDTVGPGRLPVRLQVYYNPATEETVFTAGVAMGAAVIRPKRGHLINAKIA